jgi:anti-anti-sigma factor
MAPPLTVSTSREGDVGILETNGYINGIEAELLVKESARLVQEGVRFLVLNLEKSPIANSIGISILIEVMEKVREVEGKVAFCCVEPILARTFKILGLLQAADLFDTEAEAVDLFDTEAEAVQALGG